MNTLHQKLVLLDLEEFETLVNDIDLEQIEIFVKAKVAHLFQKKEKYTIQTAVDNDSGTAIVNFFTHIIEIGSLKSIAINKLQNKLTIELQEYSYILVWAYNLCLAAELQKRSIQNVPCLGQDVYIYFTDNALKMILDRVVHHVAIAKSHEPGIVDVYANINIKENLEF